MPAKPFRIEDAIFDAIEYGAVVQSEGRRKKIAQECAEIIRQNTGLGSVSEALTALSASYDPDSEMGLFLRVAAQMAKKISERALTGEPTAAKGEMRDEVSTARELRRLANDAEEKNEFDIAGAMRDAATTVEALEARLLKEIEAKDTLFTSFREAEETSATTVEALKESLRLALEAKRLAQERLAKAYDVEKIPRGTPAGQLLDEAGDTIAQQIEHITLLVQEKDAAYLERNQLVALLSKIFPAGRKTTAIEGWDPAWHNCVFIDLPTGQASWHYHDSQHSLFEHLPFYPGEWDGHSTEEKYARIGSYNRLAHTPLTVEALLTELYVQLRGKSPYRGLYAHAPHPERCACTKCTPPNDFCDNQ